MNTEMKRLTAGQVHGARLAARVVLLPFRVSRSKEYGYMLRVMGLDKAFAWTRFWSRVVPSVAFVVALASAWLVLGPARFVLAALVANEAAGRAYKGLSRPSTTTRRGLQRLMVEEALVKVKEGEKPPKLVILSQTEDEHGRTLHVRAPVSTSVDQWQKKAHLVANRAGVPASLCSIEDDADSSPNTFWIWIGKPGGRKTRLASIPAVCDFHEPFRIGVKVNGNLVQAQTFEHNTLVGGVPGMGKTSVVRSFIVRCLRDPDGRVFLVDGKGSRTDYATARGAFTGYVNGVDDDALDQVERMLVYIHGEVDRLNTEGGLCKILLVLDEWQDIRAGANADQLARVDKLLNRITKKGRATGLHIVLATQRCSAVSIPTELRSLFRQAIAFRQKNGTDYAMVLGVKPEEGVTPPKKPGEAILSGDLGQVAVLMDHLTQEQWEDVIPTFPAREPVSLHEPVKPDRLLTLVRDVAEKFTDDRVAPSALYDALPADERPARVADLGRYLKAHGVEGGNSGGRFYRRADLLAVAA